MGRTAAAGWKQMASLCATAWSQSRVCSQGWPSPGGPGDHLGTPEAAGPQQILRLVLSCSRGCCGAGAEVVWEAGEG